MKAIFLFKISIVLSFILFGAISSHGQFLIDDEIIIAPIEPFEPFVNVQSPDINGSNYFDLDKKVKEMSTGQIVVQFFIYCILLIIFSILLLLISKPLFKDNFQSLKTTYIGTLLIVEMSLFKLSGQFYYLDNGIYFSDTTLMFLIGSLFAKALVILMFSFVLYLLWQTYRHFSKGSHNTAEKT